MLSSRSRYSLHGRCESASGDCHEVQGEAAEIQLVCIRCIWDGDQKTLQGHVGEAKDIVALRTLCRLCVKAWLH